MIAKTRLQSWLKSVRSEGRQPGPDIGAKSGMLIPSSGTPGQVRLFQDILQIPGHLASMHNVQSQSYYSWLVWLQDTLQIVQHVTFYTVHCYIQTICLHIYKCTSSDKYKQSTCAYSVLPEETSGHWNITSAILADYIATFTCNIITY